MKSTHNWRHCKIIVAQRLENVKQKKAKGMMHAAENISIPDADVWPSKS